MKTRIIGTALFSVAMLFASNAFAQEDNIARVDEALAAERDLARLNIDRLNIGEDQKAAMREQQDLKSRKMAEEQELATRRIIQQRQEQSAFARDRQMQQMNQNQQQRDAWNTYPTTNVQQTNIFDRSNLVDRFGVARFPNQSDSKLAKINNGFSQDISEMVNQIKNSEDEEKKKEFKDKISRLLDQQYEAYLDHHEEPLKQLEARLEKLREEFEARKTAKADLVKLRLDTIWYNAIGLGWPGSNTGVRSSFQNRPANPPQLFNGPQSPQWPNAATASGTTWQVPRSQNVPASRSSNRVFGPRRDAASAVTDDD